MRLLYCFGFPSGFYYDCLIFAAVLARMPVNILAETPLVYAHESPAAADGRTVSAISGNHHCIDTNDFLRTRFGCHRNLPN